MSANPPDSIFKEQALELLEWALEDMSPDTKGEKLQLKCGFERELHALPDDLPPYKIDPIAYQADISEQMDYLAKKVTERMREDGDLREVHHDKAGTFMLEIVTKPLGLRDAVRAIQRLSKQTLKVLKDLPASYADFGRVPAEDIIERLDAVGGMHAVEEYAKKCMVDHDCEVYDIEGIGKTLVGRGQHCNLSVWYHGRNLFIPHPGREEYTLANHAAAQALEWLPYMFAPCRAGNYSRIQSHASHGVNAFSVGGINFGGRADGGMDSPKTGYVLRYTADHGFRTRVPDSYRLEFRQCAAEADPLDAALASAVPLVKACDTIIEKGPDGKMRMDLNGRPLLKSARGLPSEYKDPVPEDEQSALALFNTPDNPYFVYLDALAERRIRKAEANYQADSSQENALAMRQAQVTQHIGTRLHAAYCREYGIESAMPALAVRAQRR